MNDDVIPYAFIICIERDLWLMQVLNEWRNGFLYAWNTLNNNLNNALTCWRWHYLPDEEAWDRIFRRPSISETVDVQNLNYPKIPYSRFFNIIPIYFMLRWSIILIIVDWIIFHVLGRDMISWTETSPQFWHWIKSAKFHSGTFVSSKPSENAVKWNICAQYVKRQHICSAKCIWMHGFIPVLAFYVI